MGRSRREWKGQWVEGNLLPGLTIGLTIGLTSCSGLTTIRQVQQHPQRSWFNSTVQLQGMIVDRAPLINAEVYQIQDATGKIWVFTPDPGLQVGQQIRVKGEVRFESIPLAEQERGEAYIEEQQREVISTHDESE